jgi:hypothetical protein
MVDFFSESGDAGRMSENEIKFQDQKKESKSLTSRAAKGSDNEKARYSDPTKSDKRGLIGIFETLIRRFKNLMHVLFCLPLFMLAALVMGLAMTPGILFFRYIQSLLGSDPHFLVFAMGTGISIAAGYFIYGLTMIFLVPLFNFLLMAKLKPWRGTYYSTEAIKWYIHNAATYVLRYTFLEFATPSPLSNLFYQLMGMKIGQGTVINSTHISDPSLIELGEQVTIGGSAVITGHYGQGGYLVLARTKIGRRATIGLRAVIMGGVTIGENVRLLSNSVVLPKTNIPDGETWGGVPARKMSPEELKEK